MCIRCGLETLSAKKKKIRNRHESMSNDGGYSANDIATRPPVKKRFGGGDVTPVGTPIFKMALFCHGCRFEFFRCFEIACRAKLPHTEPEPEPYYVDLRALINGILSSTSNEEFLTNGFPPGLASWSDRRKLVSKVTKSTAVSCHEYRVVDVLEQLSILLSPKQVFSLGMAEDVSRNS